MEEVMFSKISKLKTVNSIVSLNSLVHLQNIYNIEVSDSEFHNIQKST